MKSLPMLLNLYNPSLIKPATHKPPSGPSIKRHIKSKNQSPYNLVPFDPMVNDHIRRPLKAVHYPPDMGGFTIHPATTWCLMNGIGRPPPEIALAQKQLDMKPHTTSS